MISKSKPVLNFSHILGQGKAEIFFGRSLASQRLAHAYLFQGPNGVGKQLFARSVAEVINCLGNGEGRGCGVCSSCQKFSSGNHPDFLQISPEKGVIKIEQIRELKRSLSYPPYESRMRVVLLEDIHTMRREAANSLLKILEEPPEDNLLILTAEASQEVLQTISSRCQVIPFYHLSVEDTVKILCSHEPDVDQESGRLLARLSEGSPGRALQLQRGEMIGLWRRTTELLSRDSKDEDVGSILKVAEEMAELKDDLIPLLGLLRLWLRDLLVDEEERGLGEVATTMKTWSPEALFAKMDAINRAERELSYNCNRTLVCEILLFRLQ